jgi:hypothetical protein
MKNFKKFEIKLTDYFLERGLPAKRMSKAFHGTAIEDIRIGDSEEGWISVEAKTGKEAIPGYLKKFYTQAVTNCEGRIPIVVWHEDYTRIGDEFCILSLEDLTDLLVKVYLIGKE